MSTTIPPQGTHVSDGIRTGLILGTQFKAGANVLAPSSQVGTPADSQPPGTYMTPTALHDIIPAAVAAAGIAALQTTAGAGYLALVAANTIGVTVLTNLAGVTGPAGAAIIKLSNARNVTITSAADESAVTFTIFGWDTYGMAMVENIAGPNATTTLGVKAFKYIQAVYANAAVANNTSIGYGNVFGLPYYISNGNYIFAQKYNGALDAGTIVVGARAAATATTGDVRGTYTPATNADSVKRLTLNQYSTSADARVSNASIGSGVYLATNPLATGNATTTITVTAPDHQFTDGEIVTISGGSGTINGVTAATYNISAAVTVVDANSFTYQIASASGGAPASGGGTTIQMTPGKGNLYQTTFGRFGVNQYVVAFT